MTIKMNILLTVNSFNGNIEKLILLIRFKNYNEYNYILYM